MLPLTLSLNNGTKGDFWDCLNSVPKGVPCFKCFYSVVKNVLKWLKLHVTASGGSFSSADHSFAALPDFAAMSHCTALWEEVCRTCCNVER